MPQKKNSPPKVMTWMKASPVLAISAVFDAVRLLFEWFWFFGPALAGIYCTDKVGDTVGTAVGGFVCGASATVVGYFGSPAITAFGVVMAIAVGLFGWLTVGLMLMMSNARIFKENAGHALWFVASLAISEIPIIGSAPALTGVTWKMYSTQIKKDKATLKKYEQEQVAIQLQEQKQRIAQVMYIRDAQQFQQDEEQEEALDEMDDEIPDEMRGAA